MTIREFVQWPSKKNNLYAPWYVMARRLVALPIFKAGLVVACFGALLGWGWYHAKKLWEEAS